MKSSGVFPYKSDAKGNFFPVISVSIKAGKAKKTFSALVDSGATVSIFRAEVADVLRVKLESGKEIYLGGVGGHIKVYLHRLKIEIAGRKFTCPVVFSREYLVSFNLLGREGFFKKFRIIFEEKNNQLQLH